MEQTNGTTAPSLLRTFSALVNRMGLSQRLGSLFDTRRKMHEILGYKATLAYRDFKARYLRQDLAHRIVKAYPEATWGHAPVIKEDDEDARSTPFEQAWDALTRRLPVFAALERLDLLANLGQYSVLLIGLQGQSDLQQPAQPVRGPEDVLYFAPYSEEWADIERLDGNPASSTFGQPLVYRINFNRNAGNRATTMLPVGTVLVHASRVIHVAEDILDDETYGVPRLEPIYDRLDDLLKIVGGSAEMFWRDAKRRIALELRDDYRLEPEDAQALTDEVEEYMHDLKDFIRVQGVDVRPLAGTVADPEKHFNMLIDILAGETGIPKRILTGSERGELASVQDSANWLERISRRQQQFAEPQLLRKLIDRLIALRALPEPAQPYSVQWSNLLALSEKDRAAVARDYATAIAQYAGPGLAMAVVPQSEFRETYLGLPPYPEDADLDLQPGPEDDGMRDDETDDEE